MFQNVADECCGPLDLNHTLVYRAASLNKLFVKSISDDARHLDIMALTDLRSDLEQSC